VNGEPRRALRLGCAAAYATENGYKSKTGEQKHCNRRLGYYLGTKGDHIQSKRAADRGSEHSGLKWQQGGPESIRQRRSESEGAKLGAAPVLTGEERHRAVASEIERDSARKCGIQVHRRRCVGDARGWPEQKPRGVGHKTGRERDAKCRPRPRAQAAEPSHVVRQDGFVVEEPIERQAGKVWDGVDRASAEHKKEHAEDCCRFHRRQL